MFLVLLVLLVLIPVVEIYFLVKVGQVIGALNTIAVVILIGIIGAYLAKSQGIRVVSRIQSTIQRGQLPGKELVEGVMILIGGILLVTPGFFSDIIGLFFLFPLTRSGLVYIAMNYFRKRMQQGQWNFSSTSHAGSNKEQGKHYTYTYTEPDENDIIIYPPAIEDDKQDEQ